MNEKWCRGRGCRSKQFKFPSSTHARRSLWRPNDKDSEVVMQSSALGTKTTQKKKMPISRTWFFQPAITTKPTFFLLCVCVGPTRRPFYFFLSMKNVFVKIPIQNISTRLAIFPLCFPPLGYKFTCHLLPTVLLIISFFV